MRPYWKQENWTEVYLVIEDSWNPSPAGLLGCWLPDLLSPNQDIRRFFSGEILNVREKTCRYKHSGFPNEMKNEVSLKKKKKKIPCKWKKNDEIESTFLLSDVKYPKSARRPRNRNANSLSGKLRLLWNLKPKLGLEQSKCRKNMEKGYLQLQRLENNQSRTLFRDKCCILRLWNQQPPVATAGKGSTGCWWHLAWTVQVEVLRHVPPQAFYPHHWHQEGTQCPQLSFPPGMRIRRDSPDPHS